MSKTLEEKYEELEKRVAELEEIHTWTPEKEARAKLYDEKVEEKFLQTTSIIELRTQIRNIAKNVIDSNMQQSLEEIVSFKDKLNNAEKRYEEIENL